MSFLVVGLGNPGPEYEHTRHNAGFVAVDLLAENLCASYWKDEAGAKVAHVRLGDEELLLAEPQTFMNVSGAAVAKLVETYDIAFERMVVVHDDIDLPAGAVRVKRGGGHGGHNGLRSLSERLGGGDYLRVRVGVGRPPGRMDPADFVLQPMRRDALDELDAACTVAAQAVMHVLEYGIESAMQEYNAD
ncbi:MAG: aminoacyl-tRNA hydrolase [Coriobacteriaceae bacterium]|nr:aminoacyl-tRNA hydrolase [Coriobacteriaceae bacterium]